ncbi:MAG: helix-turn-helix domain-containing protein, partial [Muribaculaceae bacterium]|nr:helix-turn-helix domain-containing protein [Muribaculaceae bacterium]
QDNAMRLNLAKREGILGFKIVDTFGIEAQLIAPLSDTFQTNITADILSLHAQGFSIRKIAHSLAVTPTTVYRILQNNIWLWVGQKKVEDYCPVGHSLQPM